MSRRFRCSKASQTTLVSKLIHCPLMINPNTFSSLWTCHLVPPDGKTLNLSIPLIYDQTPAKLTTALRTASAAFRRLICIYFQEQIKHAGTLNNMLTMFNFILPKDQQVSIGTVTFQDDDVSV